MRYGLVRNSVRVNMRAAVAACHAGSPKLMLKNRKGDEIVVGSKEWNGRFEKWISARFFYKRKPAVSKERQAFVAASRVELEAFRRLNADGARGVRVNERTGRFFAMLRGKRCGGTHPSLAGAVEAIEKARKG